MTPQDGYVAAMAGRQRRAREARARWHPGRALWITAAVLATLTVLVVAVVYRTAEPLRRRIEANANRELKGYHLRIGGLRLYPIGLGVALSDVSVVQDKNPKPPVALLPWTVASINWRALIHGRLVADFRFDRPQIDVNFGQTKTEAQDPVKMKNKGWQRAAEQIYPLKINQLRVRDGVIRYRDTGDFKPLEMTGVNFVATNIRNVWSPDRTYPSGVWMRSTVFGQGRLAVDGEANFLAEPYAGVKLQVSLTGMPLGYLEPVAERFNAVTRGGVLSTHGSLEYAPKIHRAVLTDATIDDADVDFAFQSARTGSGKEVAKKVGTKVEQASDNPDMVVDIGRVTIRRSQLGIVNRDTQPQYHLFVRADPLEIRHLSNQPGAPAGEIRLDGKLMDSGPTHVEAKFVPKAPPDLDVSVEIRDTDMRALNDVWRAHGGFDVAAGRFSLFSNVTVRSGVINGYVKPLFQDIKVYDPKKEEGKSFGQKVKEAIVGGVATVLTDQSRDTVAARTDLSGRLDDPQASTLQILLSLLRNAFVKAILPGLEQYRPGQEANAKPPAPSEE